MRKLHLHIMFKSIRQMVIIKINFCISTKYFKNVLNTIKSRQDT